MMINILWRKQSDCPCGVFRHSELFYGDRGDEAADQPEGSEKTESTEKCDG